MEEEMGCLDVKIGDVDDDDVDGYYRWWWWYDVRKFDVVIYGYDVGYIENLMLVKGMMLGKLSRVPGCDF